MTDQPRPYAEAAWTYQRAGWHGPIPIGWNRKTHRWVPRQKSAPPAGYTGWAGIDPSGPDIQAWIDGPEGDCNIGLHLHADLYVLDVDAHSGKPAELALAALTRRCGPLPATWTSTARGTDAISRHHFYRAKLPEGRVWIDHPESTPEALSGLDALHTGHRYPVVWPSIHPDGNPYLWYDPTSELYEGVPEPGWLLDLPEAWILALSKPGEPLEGSAAGTAQAMDVISRFRVGEPCIPVAKVLADELTRIGDARDGGALHHPGPLYALTSYGIEGHIGVRGALSRHQAAYTEARVLLRGEATTSASADWWRMVCGAVGKKLTATGGAVLPECDCDEAVPAADTAGQPAERPLRRGDFTGIRDRKRVEPEFIKRDDGRALLYPGKDSYLYAETESGKSWLAALTVVQCVLDHVPIIVYDFEEGDELEYGNRLLDLGVDEGKLTDPSLFRYVMVDARCPAEMLAEADEMAARVVINEGMSVAYDVFGWQVKENDSATAFRRTLVKPHLVAGRAVLTTDHVVKDRETRGRYAIGGVMKLNAASGGAFLLVNVEGLSPGKRGASNLFVTKDRPGGVKRHGVPAGEKFDPQVKRIGTLVVDDSRAFVNYLDVKILPPATEDKPDEDSLTVRVLDAIDAVHDSGQTATLGRIRSQAGGRGVDVDQELDRLVVAGTLLESRGAYNARVFDRVRRSTKEEA